MQEMMAYYATMEMLPGEMRQFPEQYQPGEVKAQLRRSLFGQGVRVTLVSHAAR
jgi:hypothetical protein